MHANCKLIYSPLKRREVIDSEFSDAITSGTKFLCNKLGLGVAKGKGPRYFMEERHGLWRLILLLEYKVDVKVEVILISISITRCSNGCTRSWHKMCDFLIHMVLVIVWQVYYSKLHFTQTVLLQIKACYLWESSSSWNEKEKRGKEAAKKRNDSISLDGVYKMLYSVTKFLSARKGLSF